MGSVKDLVLESRGEYKYQEAKAHRFGLGAWRVSGRFSVGDLKDMIPPFEIQDKNHVLAMMAGAYWEHAESKGMPTCYVGMLDRDWRIVDTQTLLGKGEKSDLIVMKLASTPKEHTDEGIRAYHQAVKDGDLTVYVADAESIFRAGFPLGSSSLGRIFDGAGMGEEYARLATYDETVRGLDEIRRRFGRKGGRSQRIQTLLAKLGLDYIPNPGATIWPPVLNFTTKFALGGDEDVTEDQARERMGLTPERYEQWKSMVDECARDQIGYDRQRGITNMDGKVEAVVAQRVPRFTDFAKTPDENREMIKHTHNREEILVPTNKEIQRAIFRARGIYDAIGKAKEKSQEEYGTSSRWQDYLYNFTTPRNVEEAARDSVAMMQHAIGFVGNKALQTDIFDARPLEEWVGEFVPYASRVQD